jgi:hypothetical protein
LSYLAVSLCWLSPVGWSYPASKQWKTCKVEQISLETHFIISRRAIWQRCYLKC